MPQKPSCSLVSPRVIRGNRGDILSRWGILSTLSSLNLGPIAVFSSRDRHIPPATGELLEYGPVYNLFPTTLSGWKALWRARRVVWTGGLDLQDDSSLLKLLHLGCVFAIYRLLGLKIVCAHQGAGPLATKPGRFIARHVLGLIDTFIARDTGTYRLLKGLESRCKIVLGYDGIFLDGFDNMPPLLAGEQAAIDALFEGCTERPVIGLNVRKWFHFASGLLPYHMNRQAYDERARAPMEQFLSAMAVLLKALREQTNARIILISMYEPGIETWEDDLPYLMELRQRLDDDPEIVPLTADLSPQALLSLFSRLDVMIGTRLHSTLTALRMGRPAVHISYTLKGKDIFNDMGLGKYVINIDDFCQDPLRIMAPVLDSLPDKKHSNDILERVSNMISENRKILAQSLGLEG